MKERPILMSAPMVRALLAGTKTQTRRALKVQPFDDPSGHGIQWRGGKCLIDAGYGADYLHTSRASIERIVAKFCPYGQPGDRLWVRETWCCVHGVPDAGRTPHPDDFVRYRADGGPGEQVITDVKAWHPSIFMPRVYSRINLEITAVRVERLQDISEADALAEGINCYPFRPDDGFPICDGYTHEIDDGKCVLHESAVAAYIRLWESINGPGSWAANPWVWVLEFRRTAP